MTPATTELPSFPPLAPVPGLRSLEGARLVHVTQSVSRLAGGLFESVRHLSQSVQDATGADLTVLGLEDERAGHDVPCWAPLRVRTQAVIGPGRFGYAPGLSRALKENHPVLVHLHGLWKYPAVAVWRWARRTRRPYIVSPHGMLEPWALTQSLLAKRLAAMLYQRACLRAATCLRATSNMEADGIRRGGYSNRIALVPNGVEVPERLPARAARSRRNRRLLFLSRIHPKKGLLNLVKAWHAAGPSDWELVIAGPDEGGHLAEVKAAAQARGLGQRVIFCGEVWGRDKVKLYCESDLFVLPSLSENFGLVVPEALSCELPVITTQATPWQELERHQCGWWIGTGVAPLAQALKTACALPDAALYEMGRRGRELVAAKYTWGPIGIQMAQVYEWMLGLGERPECVV